MIKTVLRQFRGGKKLMQYSVYKAFGEIFEMLVPLGLAMVVVPNLFGVYSLMKMVVFLFASIFVYSSLAPFIVFSNQEFVERGKINKSFSAQLVITAVTTVLFLVITVVFNNYIAKFTDGARSDLFFICLAYFGLVIKYITSRIFLAQNKRDKESQFSLVYGFLNIASIIVLYLLGRITIGSLFTAYFLTSVLSLAIFIRHIDFKILFPFVFDRGHFKKMFDFTKWLIFGAASLYLINWGDNFVLRYYVSISDIGVYNLGYQIFKGFMGLLLIIGSYYLPVLSQKINELRTIRTFLFSIRPKIILAGLALTAVFIIILPYLFNLVYSHSYDDAIVVIKILAIGMILELYNVFYATLFTATKNYKFTQITNVIHVTINILLNLVFVPKYGIIGAAIGTVIAYFIRNVIYEFYLYIKYRQYSLFNKPIKVNQ